MAKRIQLRRGTTAENNAFKGALGEVTVDTTIKQLRLHDNSKVGGFKIPTYDDAFGVGQTWQDVTASRAVNTTYTNSTGKPILVIYRVSGANNASATAIVGGVIIATVTNSAQYVTRVPMSFIVPVGSIYNISGTTTGFEWAELR